MDKWDEKYKEMLNEELGLEGENPEPSLEMEEEQPQETEIPSSSGLTAEELDDPLYAIASALILVLNGKDDGEADEEAFAFLELVNTMSEKFRSKFSGLIKTATINDERDGGKTVSKIQKDLKDLFQVLKKAKENDASNDSESGGLQ